jgi:hypothetical protein
LKPGAKIVASLPGLAAFEEAKVEWLQSFKGYPQQEGLAERMPIAQPCLLSPQFLSVAAVRRVAG